MAAAVEAGTGSGRAGHEVADDQRALFWHTTMRPFDVRGGQRGRGLHKVEKLEIVPLPDSGP